MLLVAGVLAQESVQAHGRYWNHPSLGTHLGWASHPAQWDSGLPALQLGLLWVPGPCWAPSLHVEIPTCP